MSDFLITAGATSRRVPVWLADSSSTTGAGLTGLAFNSAGLSCYYWRESDANVGGTNVVLVTAARGTFASGGFVEKDAANLPGLYEFGIPDAALAAGAKWVKVMFKGATNLAPRVITIKLSAFDLDTATVTLANGGITTAKFGAGAIDAAALAADAGNEIADAILARNIAGGSSGGRTVSQALYALRNKQSVSGGTLTVYGVDDTTSSWTAALTGTASVTLIDPA